MKHPMPNGTKINFLKFKHTFINIKQIALTILTQQEPQVLVLAKNMPLL
jgi:hypothetical protein